MLHNLYSHTSVPKALGKREIEIELLRLVDCLFSDETIVFKHNFSSSFCLHIQQIPTKLGL